MHRLRPPWLPVALPAVLGGACLLPLWALPASTAQGVASGLNFLAVLVAGVLLLRSARAGDLAQRRSRRFLAASLGAVAGGALLSVGYVAATGSVPVPSLVDVVALLWVPLAAVGLWLTPSFDGGPIRRQRLMADMGVAGASLLFASWMLVLKPIATAGRWSQLGQAVQVAYPVTDVLMATMVLSLLPRARADQRAFLNVVALGLLLVALGDSGSALHFASTGLVSFGWPSVVLQAGLVTLAYGAWARRGTSAGDARSARGDGWIPFLAPLVAITAAITRAAQGRSLGLVEVALGSSMVCAMVLRQMNYVREITFVAEGHRRAATHDGLTGLPNRTAFIEQLTERVLLPGSGPAAVVIVDLDGFKGINDSLGHDIGDQVLVDFAAALSRAAAPHLVARLGGDEFALLVVADDPENEAERIARTLTRLAMPGAAGLLITCSAGISALRAGDTPAAVLRRADLAMFWVKRSPYARVAVFDELMAQRADRRGILLAQLTGVAERGELRLLYQPVFRIQDTRLAGAEVLLRWRHPVLGDVPPDEFIPLAEENGDIREIGAWVIDTALAQVAAWRQQGRLLPQLLINVATAQFTEDLPGCVAAALERHGLPAGCLVLEITEGQISGLATNAAVQRLRASGVRVAMDDFGSGYSSLAQLARLPVDILKIDREFIRNLDVVSGRYVLDAVVTLARALGLETVAEGIEEPAQAASVARSGIDYAQGYLYARPLAPDELFDRLPLPIVTPPRTHRHETYLGSVAE